MEDILQDPFVADAQEEPKAPKATQTVTETYNHPPPSSVRLRRKLVETLRSEAKMFETRGESSRLTMLMEEAADVIDEMIGESIDPAAEGIAAARADNRDNTKIYLGRNDRSWSDPKLVRIK